MKTFNRIITFVVAVVLLYLNLQRSTMISEKAPDVLGPVGRYTFYRGWPLSPYMVCIMHGGKFHPEEEESWVVVLVIDGIVFLLALVAAWYFSRLVLFLITRIWNLHRSV